MEQHGSNGPDAARLGDVLVAAELVSRGDLLKSILAQRVDRVRGCALFANLPHTLLDLLAEGFEEISVDIGEMVYFTGGTRTAFAGALETSELLRTTHERLTDCFERTPALAHALIDVVSARLRRTNQVFQENQYRLHSAERSLKHLNDFPDLSEAAELGAGIEGLIDRLVHTASCITDAERATLFLIDPATGDLWSKLAEGAEVKEIRVPASPVLSDKPWTCKR